MQAQPSATDPTAVGGQRLVACVIDVGLGWLIYIVMFVALSKPIPPIYGVSSYNYCSGRTLCQNFGSRYVSGGAAAAIIVVQLVYLIGVFVLQRGITGRTLGSNVFGIVTVNEEGQPLGPGMALVRSLAGIVDYIPCCFPLVGTITIFTTKGHRRVGDMAAKSFVVPRARAGQPIFVPGVTGYGATPYAQPYTQPYAPPASQPYGTPTSQPYGTPTSQPYGTPTSQPYGTPTSQPYGTPTSQPYGTPGGPTDPTDPAGYAEPTAGSPPVADGPPAPVDPTQPQWDPARSAYIQWDATGQRWMQFDQATQQWGPIR